ncbi:MAG: hypothetical protein E3K36_15660 [Candidatus Brocadia sp.]|nr:hypothetical protein [Candidatus Brocadia sp.]
MKYFYIILCVSAVFWGNGILHVNAQEQLQTQELAEMGQEQEPVLTDKPLEIWTFIDDYRIITGKTLHLTVQVLWKLGVTVNLESVDKIDLSPFKVEGVIIGERQIFDNEHDYLIITYALSLPSDMKDGIYSIPSLSLSYRNEVDKSEGMAASSPVAVKKVPILVEGKVDKDVITIGDRVNYALTIRHEKNVKLLWETIEKLNFSPFEVLKTEREQFTEGNIEKIVLNYTLSLYELGGKKKTPEIPELTILYYVESPSKPDKGTGTIETKEVKTVAIPIIVNSLLKAVDVPLEGIKGPMYYSKKSLFSHGYLPMSLGVVLFLFLGVTALRSIVGKVSPASPKPISETPQIALERLKNAISSSQFTEDDSLNQENVYNINKALRTYLGVLIGISNATAQSATTSNFLKYDTKKRLPEESSIPIQTVLKQLDSLIFGKHVEKEAFDKMLQGAEGIIAWTGPK